RKLPNEFQGTLPPPFEKVRVFVPGCLVVQGPKFANDRDAAAALAKSPALKDWPLVVLVDDADQAARSSVNFLWTTFTRFEPAADIHANELKLVRSQPSYTPPIVIDSRMKPDYPDELFCDPDTASLVSKRWNEYFPAGGIEMGDSDRGHLD
ncbi:MAG: hypothetical protein ACI89X_004743, partial [Planctomycetota bacterium]